MSMVNGKTVSFVFCILEVVLVRADEHVYYILYVNDMFSNCQDNQVQIAILKWYYDENRIFPF